MLLKNPFVTYQVAAAIHEAINDLSTWVAASHSESCIAGDPSACHTCATTLPLLRAAQRSLTPGED